MKLGYLLVVMLFACRAPQVPAQGDARGETNGRSLDVVAPVSADDEWVIRLRGTSFWVGRSVGGKSQELGTVTLTSAEASALWQHVDAADLTSRGPGRAGPDTWTFRVRQPSGDGHATRDFSISRKTDDDEVIALIEALEALASSRFEQPVQL